MRSPIAARLLTGRSLVSRTFFPIGTQLVVLFTLYRIAEDLMRFINLLEFLFSQLFILRHIGMILSGEFAEGLLDLVVARAARNSQRHVIIFKLDGHREKFYLLRSLTITLAGRKDSLPRRYPR